MSKSIFYKFVIYRINHNQNIPIFSERSVPPSGTKRINLPYKLLTFLQTNLCSPDLMAVRRCEPYAVQTDWSHKICRLVRLMDTSISNDSIRSLC